MGKKEVFEIINKLKKELEALVIESDDYKLILEKSQELDNYINLGMKIINYQR
jgi:hypothetical protein